MTSPRTYVDIFADGQAFSVRQSGGELKAILEIGADTGVKIFLADADLTRLRYAIDAYLSESAQLRAEAEIARPHAA